MCAEMVEIFFVTTSLFMTLLKPLHQIHINSHATHTHTLVKCTKTKHEKSNAVVSVKIGHKFTGKKYPNRYPS